MAYQLVKRNFISYRVFYTPQGAPKQILKLDAVQCVPTPKHIVEVPIKLPRIWKVGQPITPLVRELLDLAQERRDAV